MVRHRLRLKILIRLGNRGFGVVSHLLNFMQLTTGSVVFGLTFGAAKHRLFNTVIDF